MSETIFTKIIRGDIPAYKVYENDHVLSFLDIHPIAKGHTLVVPKRAVETILELSEEEGRELMSAVQQTMKRLEDVLHPEGFTVGWNHLAAGGQAVPHLHVHILPRWHADGGRSMHAVVDHPGDESVADVAKKFTA